MSALYMSKVANQDSINSPAKVEQDQSLEPGKKVKLTKMKEDSRQTTDDLPPLPPERLEAGIDDQQLKPSQLSKQMLYQQRQKSELKRLLKHTHPELKMLDDVVDEELAEVLSSEGATVGETGYEGEVLSRCLIFENCGSSTSMSPYTTKIHMAHDTEERCDCSKTPGVSEKLREGPVTEGVKGIIEKENDLDLGPNCDEQTEEEMIKVNVQATRRMFESQSRPDPDGIQGNVSVSLNKGKIGQKPTKQSGSSSREKLNDDRKVDLEEQSQEPCGHFGQSNQEDQTVNGELPNDETSFEWDSTSSPESESQSEKIITSAALFQNNPFMLTNIEKENSYGQTPATQTQNNGAGEDHLVSNVKRRTHLFESMPFDKIRHQNRDEIETMVENIKETLNFLFCVKAIQSAGTIIEVNETMIAKKAKFTLTDGGPELQYDEVAEGGAQNFIVQLLPRVNLKPQITYLKEDSQGSMEATVVEVLVHQQRFNTKKDTEVKTANVVQLMEDILNQDNSLRKGVIFQKDVDNCEEVIVYSLYKYLDEEDVKSYSPLKTAESETETGSTSTTDDEETRRGLRSLQEAAEDQSCSESVRPYLKVNVKLFKSCIERGDLEYLKSLQEDEPTAQAEDSSHNQTAAGQDKESNHEESRNLAEESDSEYVPVDVKRLKRMFSEDKSPVNRSCIKSVNMSNASSGKRQSSAKCNTEASSHQQQVNTFKEYGGQKHEEVVPQDDDNVHQAEVAEVVEDADEIFDLRSAIQNLQQMTKEAKSLYQSSMQKSCNEEPSKTAETPDDVEPSRKETELPRGNMDLRVESGWEQKNTETRQEEQTAEVCCKSQECTNSVQSHLVSPPSLEKPPAPEEEEDVFQGKIQAALDSLEKSNVNVTKGDFRAAMIYRNSSKSHQGLSQNNENLHTKELCPMTKPKSTQTLAKQDVSRSADESNTGSVSKKRPAGPKPPVPPKPEHLKLKQAANLPTVTINQEETEIKSIKVTVPQVQSSTSDKEQHLFKSSNESMMGHQGNELLEEDKQMSQEPDEQHQAEGSKDESVVSDQQEINATGQEISSQRAPGNDHTNETGEIHIGLCEECQKREGTKTFSAKTTPAKPKRQKGPYLDRNPPDERVNQRAIQVMADQSSDARGITPESEGEPTKDMRQENKVEMREKKGGTETEDQR